MENYYEPKLNDLYQGLEVEAKLLDIDLNKKRDGEDFDFFVERYKSEYGTKEKWIKTVLPVDFVLTLNYSEGDGYSMPDGIFRIKYLDKEDIVSLGWNEKEEDIYENNNLIIVHIPHENVISIMKNDEYLVQSIICKNKTEFKDLLKRLHLVAEFKKINKNNNEG